MHLKNDQDPTASMQFHRVKKDEKIHEIATRFGTTDKQLQPSNGISRNKKLTLGQKIVVPQAMGEMLTVISLTVKHPLLLVLRT